MKKNKKKNKQKRKPAKTGGSDSQNLVIDWETIITFTVISALFAGTFIYDGVSVFIGLMTAVFIAYVGLPYIDSKKWKPRPISSAVIGGVLGCAIAISRSAAPEIIILSVLAGLIVGFFSDYWVGHITL